MNKLLFISLVFIFLPTIPASAQMGSGPPIDDGTREEIDDQQEEANRLREENPEAAQCIDYNTECRSVPGLIADEESCKSQVINGVQPCDWYEGGRFNLDTDFCGVATDQQCQEYCFANYDRTDDQVQCYYTKERCVTAFEAIGDKDQVGPIACGEVNNASNRSGGTNYEGGSITGSGIDASFELDGFKPFEPVIDLYDDNNLPSFINSLLGFLIGISGVIVVIMILAAGFEYVTSAAGGKKVEAKGKILNALGGLGLLLASVALLNTLNPQLLNLQGLRNINVTITREEFQGESSPFGNRGNFGGSIDDLYRPSSNISCANGTVDEGVITAYAAGQPYEIRLCSIPGVGGNPRVNSRISADIKAMFDAMKADGLNPSVKGSFRSMERQEYFWNCYQTQSCNGGSPAARPGYSNHQSGNALDINTGGSSATVIQNGCQARPSNPTWAWLNENAARFNMKQLCSEAWHWSPDGR